ncbi:MAG: ATP-binding protein, partial [Myxococcota bacterium]
RQLLDYAGHTQVVSERMDANALIKGIDALIEAGVTRKTDLSFDLSDATLTVNGDADQLKQVILNLITNASDASATSISLRTDQRRLECSDLRRARVGQDLEPGEYACIRISDDGQGIAESDLVRVFDPFFTTRFTGRGLGLSAVAGIVRAHSGAVFIDSNPGEGTEVLVALPISEEGMVASAVAPVALKPGRPHVLLVDDDATTRRSVRRLLELDDVLITEASNGDEALEKAHASTEGFDVVLLDLTMPKRGGVETFPDLAKTLPEARIVIMSGYDSNADGVGQILDHPSFGGFLAKPYTLAMLREAVTGEILQEEA